MAVVQRSNRDDILDAVAACVRDLGVRRTTMAEIARRAGVSRSTLYTHFADVTAATAGALTRELLALLAGVPAHEPGQPVRARMVARAVHLARAIPDNPLVERILDLDPELLVRYLVERLGSSQRAILAAVTAEVVEGQEEGSVRPGDPAAIALTTFLVGQAFVVSSRIVASEVERDVALAELARALDRVLAPDGADG